MEAMPAPTRAKAADPATAPAVEREPVKITALRNLVDRPEIADYNRKTALSLLERFDTHGDLAPAQRDLGDTILQRCSQNSEQKDAHRKLRQLLDAGKIVSKDVGFAESLMNGYSKYGSFSPKQLPYVHRLIEQAESAEKFDQQMEEAAQGKTPAGYRDAGPIIDLTRLMEHFRMAQDKGLVQPRIRIGDLVLKLATAKSRTPGAVFVMWQGEYVGIIYRNGLWEPKKHCPATVTDRLVNLGNNLAKEASVFGRETGVCCFCSHELTDERSVSVGYGPICAGNYGLPWG